MSLSQIKVPDQSIPGRYLVIGYMGRRSEVVHRWANRSHAQANADDVIDEGYSVAFGGRYDKVQVRDSINGTIVYERRKPVRRYGS